jgi:hypothetical protein
VSDEPIIIVAFRASTLDALGRHLYDAPHKIARLVLPEIEAAVEAHNALIAPLPEKEKNDAV